MANIKRSFLTPNERFLVYRRLGDQAKHQGAVRGAPFESAGDAMIADSPMAQSV
jgi:hypothetical protein